MIKNKKAESLIGIVIGVSILAFVLIGIVNVLSFYRDSSLNFEDTIFKYIIAQNNSNIVKKLDLNLDNDETFYLYRDTVNKEFKVLTGVLNEDYKYLDKLGNKIDVSENLGKVFNLELTRKMDILRHSIEPSEIPNIVFHFDAQNPNGDGPIPINTPPTLSTWTDISGNGYDASISTSSKEPEYNTGSINSFPFIKFDGNDILKIDNNITINTDDNSSGNCGAGEFTFNQKSYAIVLKTGTDINTIQYIYDQGGNATGYSFSIKDGSIYAGIYNKAYVGGYDCFSDSSQEWDQSPTDHRYKSVNLGSVFPNTIYYIMIVQDSTHTDSGGEYIDTANTLKIYLNGELADETDHVDPMPEHWKIGLGGVNESTVYPWDTNTATNTQGCSECDYFTGGIGEFISWNHALTQTEITGIHNYFKERWLYGNQNIKYNITELDSSKKYDY